ncbi:hypothetical protein ACLI1A_10465 [Flavobacterium sp. RHBU_3]|uniref:hypothetical protein n=1 Tax=Flavobacterium sp. RHBU_3 TaxID=3391184 RepID=UPI00398548B6
MNDFFDDPLIEVLLIARDKQKTIGEIKFHYGSTLKEILTVLNSLDGIHIGIKEFYSEITDGFELNWKKDKNGFIGGNIQLATTKYLFADPESFGLYDEATAENADIRFFHPLDYPSPESYVGFVIRPDSIYKSVYYVSISDYQLYNLDLDFNGYTQMAVEARVFNHWQKVLLYYMGVSETGVSETETFKTEMPKIFPDWTWENFIAKFENLRLSNNT